MADLPVKREQDPKKPVGTDPNKAGPGGPQQVQVIQGNTSFLTVKLLNDILLCLKEIKDQLILIRAERKNG